MINFSLFTAAVVWAPLVSHIFIFLLMLGVYRRRLEMGEKYPSLLSAIAWISVIFRFAYIGSISLVQYWIWSKDRVGSILLELPVKKAGDFSALQNRFGYFFLYIFEHYWLNFLLSIVLALIFFLFLKLLQKYRGRFFNIGETTLGAIFVFLAGWPNGFAFIILSFLLVVVIAAFRLIAKRGELTTLGLPFMLSGSITLLLGDIIVISSGLSVLMI